MGGGGSGTVEGAGRKGGCGCGRRRGEDGKGHHSSAELSRTGDRTGDGCGMHTRMRIEEREAEKRWREPLNLCAQIN